MVELKQSLMNIVKEGHREFNTLEEYWMVLSNHFFLIISSLVGFSSTMRSMGTTAKTQLMTNYKNTIGGFKTLLGREYSDPIVQNEMNRQHYSVQQLPGDQLGIKVTVT